MEFADPWEHLLGMGLGVVAANQMVKWDAKAQEDLDKLIVKAKEANERRYFGILPFLWGPVFFSFFIYLFIFGLLRLE